MLAAVSVAATGCLEDMRKDETGNVYSQIEIRLVLPEGVDVPLENIEIVAANASKTRSIVYTTTTDAQGVAQLVVEKGIYDLKAQFTAMIDDEEKLLMGSNSNMDAMGDVDTEVKLILAYHVGELIIKEAYICGCKDNNNSNYSMKDQYVIIYNNSDEVQYLDNMGLATVQDMNTLTTAASGWQPVFDEGKVALYQYVFCFPTNETGDRFPLQPGEQAVVSTNAIDHRTIASASVDLGKEGYFALYYPGFGSQTPPDSERGVITMDLVYATGTLPMYSISTTTPAFVLYRIEGMTPLEYKDQPGSLRKKPGASATTEYLVIDKRWILDGIEFGNANTTTHKRLPIEVNTDIPKNNVTIGSGLSWHRKVKEVIDGRIIYQDTNNTADDFEQREIPSLREE